MQNRVKSLITRYLEQALTDDERAELSRLLQTEQGKQVLGEMIDQEAQIILMNALCLAPATTDRIWSRIEENLETTTARKINWRIWGWAASILLLLGAGLVFRLYQPVGEKLYYATGKGQKRSIILPDGSLVTLNSNSKISFIQNNRTRNVTLSGEAFFDVKRNPEKPFKVAATGVQIKVLGTSFNVKAYQEDQAVSTTLLEGKVHLETDAGNGMEMSPNQQVHFRKQDLALVPGDMAAYYQNNWRSGKLVFEDEPLAHILPVLEQWYGVRFEVAPENAKCRFSMSIETETLDQVLRFFELSEGIKFNRSAGGVISLGGDLCR